MGHKHDAFQAVHLDQKLQLIHDPLFLQVGLGMPGKARRPAWQGHTVVPGKPQPVLQEVVEVLADSAIGAVHRRGTDSGRVVGQAGFIGHGGSLPESRKRCAPGINPRARIAPWDEARTSNRPKRLTGLDKRELMDSGGIPPDLDLLRKAARVKGPSHGGLTHIYSADDVIALILKGEGGTFSERAGAAAAAWRALLEAERIYMEPRVPKRAARVRNR